MGQKFFPNLKKWLTTGKVSYVWLVAITLGLFVLLTYPFFFNWWAINFWGVPEEDLSDFTKLGPLGDIYGSLNTLISSIALSAVAFSAYLQVTSLNEARSDNKKQLDLAEKSHAEQVIESRNAIFATKFYSLLNFKKDKLNSFTLQRTVIDKTFGFKEIQENSMEAIDVISSSFYKISKRDNKRILNFTNIQLQNDFQQIARELGYKSVSILIAYFYIYTSLCELIATSGISDNDKKFYKNVLSNSMSQGEQILLFWIVPMFPSSIDISGSEIFTMFGHTDAFEPFALKFHKIDHFKNDEWKNIFPDNETPA
ncbi:TPA: hypothetical protein OV749_001368 [Acinetobacter baumannii]|nr:hypothetical protein [Acinetobacter baumannii]